MVQLTCLDCVRAQRHDPSHRHALRDPERFATSSLSSRPPSSLTSLARKNIATWKSSPSCKEGVTSHEEDTVDAIAAEKLPWASHLKTVGGNNYVVFNKVNISILYGGALCALGGTVATVTGSAGALFNNKAEAATFSATKTELKALGAAIEWDGVFPTEAFEWHREQPLTVS